MSKPKKSSNQLKLRGAEGFEAHYSALYGSRWESLKQSFFQPIYYQSLPSLGTGDGHYHLDQGSALIAELALGPVEETFHPSPDPLSMADFCAAPGGKTLVMAQMLSALGPDYPWTLVANELSAQRRSRLKQNLESFLPPWVQERISVTPFDAGRFGVHRPASFDRILLDAPCSSERHLVESPSHLDQWSQNRSKHLSIQAFGLLRSAFLALKPRGRLVYATCALDPRENEQVLDRLFKKEPTAIQTPVEKLGKELPSWVEPGAHGFYILPDSSGGRGPLYFCPVDKAPEQHPGEQPQQ